MDAKARRALAIIRECVAADRCIPLQHFVDRMSERGLFWPDVLAIADAPTGVRGQGLDEFDRPKWVLSGTAADGVALEFVCVLDTDDRGHVTVFITIY